ncbi:MAG TPA: hypothetical protein PLV42_07225 [bacterium]|nr:hypothetical protein [bacterium]
MMLSPRLSIALFILFIAALLTTGIFWLFLSDRHGFTAQDEPLIAEIINREFRTGDIIFPAPDWDIGFTRYLRDGITDISYTLHAFTKEELSDLNNNGVNVLWFVVDSEQRWNNIRDRLALREQGRFPAGESLVIKAQASGDAVAKLFDFTDDLALAKEVYFADANGNRDTCSWDRDRWKCGNQEWQYVGPQRTLMAGRWQKANWAHPRTERTLHVVFENTVGATALVLGTSFLERAYREENGKPVRVTVTVDGKELLKYENENIKKLYRHRVALPEGAQMIDLAFWVKFDGARHFVFNGYLGK